MKANELRIGNLVGFPSGVKYKVDMLYSNYECLDYWQPIPLTEEILLKFGFVSDENKEDNYFVKLKYGNFIFQSDLSVDFRKVYLNINKQDIIVEYLHQLQNIYFAITGFELAYENETTLKMMIQDQGNGFKKKDLPFLFQRFYRGENSKGTGLGLYIAKEIIEAHHGFMKAYNQQGACFEIVLPQMKMKKKI